MRWIFVVVAAAALAQQPAPRILVAYHSGSGHTEKLAVAIGKGAAAAGAEIAVRKVADVKDEEMLGADGIIVGSPVHWSNLSSDTRRFLDRLGAVLWKAKTNGDGRTGGAFCTGGGVSMGKDSARLSILSALITMRFTIVGGVDASGFGTLGPAATTGPDDPGISDQELNEARQFGERFATITRARPSARAREHP